MECWQNTLVKPLEFSGPGIHTGKVGRIKLIPAGADTGHVFVHGDSFINATYANVVNTQRCTVLGDGNGLNISTVEHLLASLYGMKIDNVLIEFDGPEVPILDGSALEFTRAIEEVGLEAQATLVDCKRLTKPVFVAEGESLVMALPSERTMLTVAVDYECAEVGSQIYTFNYMEEFATQVAPARTFGFWKEVEALMDKGLALGGDLNNALIFGRPKDQPAQQLRFPDEPVRHKMLDLMGDLSLLGSHVCAHIVAVRAGHALHCTFVRKLAQVLGL